MREATRQKKKKKFGKSVLWILAKRLTLRAMQDNFNFLFQYIKLGIQMFRTN